MATRNCDVAWLSYPWPHSQGQQIRFLQRIPCSKWNEAPDFDFILEGYYNKLATLQIPTLFGMRWFEIYQNRLETHLLILKQSSNKASIDIRCVLSASQGQVEATFRLQNGAAIGFQSFEVADSKKPLFAQDLLDAAREQALAQRLLETPHERLCCCLPGFTSPVPSGLPLCNYGTPVTENGLQSWLLYLRGLGTTELEALADAPMSSAEEGDYCKEFYDVR